MHFYRKCWFDPFEEQFISPFLSDCPSLMLGIAIHCIQHSQAMLERGVCELAHSFSHFIMYLYILFFELMYSIFNQNLLPIILIWIRTWNEYLKQRKYKINSYNQYSFIFIGYSILNANYVGIKNETQTRYRKSFQRVLTTGSFSPRTFNKYIIWNIYIFAHFM